MLVLSKFMRGSIDDTYSTTQQFDAHMWVAYWPTAVGPAESIQMGVGPHQHPQP